MDIIYKKICTFKFILVEKINSSNLKFIINNVCNKFIIYSELNKFKNNCLSPKIIFIVSDKIKNTDNIKNLLLKNEFEVFTDLKCKIPTKKILINSYMSFILPSFCKKQICDDILLENIFIFPHKLNDKYIKIMYRN